ncbi:MAG: hypothetical protein Q9M13_08415 [Mariprofundales bacterium]|nr:hypothetical protein [Mariprofundales bacterium]
MAQDVEKTGLLFRSSGSFSCCSTFCDGVNETPFVTMKRALNNPLVVGVLVLLAVAFVLRDFIHLSSMVTTTPDHVAGSSSPPAGTPVATLPQVAQPAGTPPAVTAQAQRRLQHCDWERLAAVPLTSRDPFAAQQSPPHLSSNRRGAADDEEGGALLSFPDFRLRAIVSAAEVSYASIDGELLEVGDSIEGWRLVAIGVNRVQLRGEPGLLTLDIDGGAKMGGVVLSSGVVKRAGHPPGTAVGGAESGRDRAALPVGAVVDSADELNIYRSLFDSLVKSGVISDPIAKSPSMDLLLNDTQGIKR